MAEVVRDFGREYFELFVKEDKYLSNTVTCIKNTKDIDIGKLNKALSEKGYMIYNGYGDLKDKTFRISHISDFNLEEVIVLLNTIINILKFNKDINRIL